MWCCENSEAQAEFLNKVESSADSVLVKYCLFANCAFTLLKASIIFATDTDMMQITTSKNIILLVIYWSLVPGKKVSETRK